MGGMMGGMGDDAMGDDFDDSDEEGIPSHSAAILSPVEYAMDLWCSLLTIYGA
ncbi:unnamed protein product, partial [Ilex paraguariensis]